jgi:hypothetical protein
MRTVQVVKSGHLGLYKCHQDRARHQTSSNVICAFPLSKNIHVKKPLQHIGAKLELMISRCCLWFVSYKTNEKFVNFHCHPVHEANEDVLTTLPICNLGL